MYYQKVIDALATELVKPRVSHSRVAELLRELRQYVSGFQFRWVRKQIEEKMQEQVPEWVMDRSTEQRVWRAISFNKQVEVGIGENGATTYRIMPITR